MTKPSYIIERLIGNAARDMQIDRAELRRRNTVPASAMPFKTGLVYTDCGEFGENLERALAMADYAGFERPRRSARARVAARHRLRQYHRTDLSGAG